MTESDGPDDVLGGLPRTRPQRPNARREAARKKTAAATEQGPKGAPVAKAAKAKAAPAAKPAATKKPTAARKPAAAKPKPKKATPAKAAKPATARAPRTPPAPPKPAPEKGYASEQPEGKPGAPELVADVVRTTGKLAEKTIRGVLSRLPKP